MQSCSSPLWRKMRSHWPIWRVEPPPVERPLPEYARHRSRAALRGVDRSVDSQHFVVVVRCLGAVEESTGWSSLPTALPPSRLRSPRCYIQVSPGNCRKFWTDDTIYIEGPEIRAGVNGGEHGTGRALRREDAARTR